MAKSLYVTATECYCEKSVISMGLIQSISRQVKKIAFFLPIIDVDILGNPQDADVAVFLKQFAVDTPLEEMYACTYTEARDLVTAGKSDILFEKIVTKFKQIEAKNDFILCQGTCFCGKNMAFEFELNANIAAQLNIPIALLINGKGKTLTEVRETVKTSLTLYRTREQEVACVFINRSLNEEELEREQANTDLPLYAIPEDSSLSDPDEALAVFEQCVNGDMVARYIMDYYSARMTPKLFEHKLFELATQNRVRIVLPEGEEERVLVAADSLHKRKAADLILLGNPESIKRKIQEYGLDFDVPIVDPATSEKREAYAQAYYEMRKHKGVTLEEARTRMLDITHYGTMMVHFGDADGMVSGSITTTADTVRPAFEIIKPRPGTTTVSSVCMVCLKDRILAFGDCAINPNPTAHQMAEIAINTAEMAAFFGLRPRVGMLSYSTGDSGKGPEVDKVVEATRLAHEMAPKLELDGPIQYDAAIAPEVAKVKMPGSPVAGKVSVFIFPNLTAANSTYKSVQRAASAVVVGPILHGLNKPINDLSRGCSVSDIINTVLVTAIQAQNCK